MTTVDWILVADRSQASILHVLPNRMAPLPIIERFDHPEGRLTGRDLYSDASGRIQLAGKARTAVEPHEDHKHVDSRRFAKELVDALEHHRQERRFDRLFVIAPPMFLGILRESFSTALRETIIAEIPKELTQLTESDLQSRLVEIVTSAEFNKGHPIT